MKKADLVKSTVVFTTVMLLSSVSCNDLMGRTLCTVAEAKTVTEQSINSQTRKMKKASQNSKDFDVWLDVSMKGEKIQVEQGTKISPDLWNIPFKDLEITDVDFSFNKTAPVFSNTGVENVYVELKNKEGVSFCLSSVVDVVPKGQSTNQTKGKVTWEASFEGTASNGDVVSAETLSKNVPELHFEPVTIGSEDALKAASKADVENAYLYISVIGVADDGSTGKIEANRLYDFHIVERREVSSDDDDDLDFNGFGIANKAEKTISVKCPEGYEAVDVLRHIPNKDFFNINESSWEFCSDEDYDKSMARTGSTTFKIMSWDTIFTINVEFSNEKQTVNKTVKVPCNTDKNLAKALGFDTKDVTKKYTYNEKFRISTKPCTKKEKVVVEDFKTGVITTYNYTIKEVDKHGPVCTDTEYGEPIDIETVSYSKFNIAKYIREQGYEFYDEETGKTIKGKNLHVNTSKFNKKNYKKVQKVIVTAKDKYGNVGKQVFKVKLKSPIRWYKKPAYWKFANGFTKTEFKDITGLDDPNIELWSDIEYEEWVDGYGTFKRMPIASGKILCNIPYHARVKILGVAQPSIGDNCDKRYNDGAHAYIEYKGKRGWISCTFLTDQKHLKHTDEWDIEKYQHAVGFRLSNIKPE